MSPFGIHTRLISFFLILQSGGQYHGVQVCICKYHVIGLMLATPASMLLSNTSSQFILTNRKSRGRTQYNPIMDYRLDQCGRLGRESNRSNVMLKLTHDGLLVADFLRFHEVRSHHTPTPILTYMQSYVPQRWHQFLSTLD